jgi:hypothetical protein
MARPVPLLLALLTALTAACGDSVPPCENAEPILNIEGEPSGYERCADGSAIRVASVPVDLEAYVEQAAPCDHPTYAEDQDCYEHSDCGDDGLSYCVCQRSYWSDFNVCVTACESDADCQAGTVCVAPEQGGSHLDLPRCRSAACTGPAACDSGLCGANWATGNNSAYFATACRTAGDACRVDQDCGHGSYLCWPTEDPSPTAPAWACEPKYFEE